MVDECSLFDNNTNFWKETDNFTVIVFSCIDKKESYNECN